MLPQVTEGVARNCLKDAPHPMSIATMQQKLGRHHYLTLKQFDGDVKLMVSNCQQCSASDQPVVKVQCVNQ